MIRFPRTPVAGFVWLYALALVITVMCVVAFGGPPPDPWIAALTLLLIWLGMARAHLVRPSELAGETLEHRMFFRSRTRSIAHARKLGLIGRDLHGGFGMLHIQTADRKNVYLHMTMHGLPFVRTGMDADTFERLADALLLTGHPRAQDMRTVLRLQAAHVRAGGRLETSPLRPPRNADKAMFDAAPDALGFVLMRASQPPPGS